jgi:hypothetical protein
LRLGLGEEREGERRGLSMMIDWWDLTASASSYPHRCGHAVVVLVVRSGR